MNTTTTTIQKEQAFYTVKQASAVLTDKGMPLSVRSILKYINQGDIKATKCLLRAKCWMISHEELLRLVNQGNN